MGETIALKARDGFECAAYKASPKGAPKGGLVVIQEIFGVNSHIRSVADRFAAEGYLAVAPALFDRAERGLELGYKPDDIARGAAVRAKVKNEDALADIEAAIAVAAEGGKVGVVGYCWGGTLAYASACRLKGLAAAVCYYGGGIAGMLDETPKIPTIMHFGALDKHIPQTDVEKIKAAYPHLAVFVYDADHGFNCDQRGSFNQPAADLARARTLEFLGDKLA
ncbi:dienelactone hydrolase family protein [Alsobacter sp. SYSU M60028]|uniref:Dienelactone hydrolase family protein n=1 Tax=Alsobacter ponti TaxID=2962936 RepID=A0ABT1LAA1_9HYPH|nr:dienelactone hydrolase family protein [Alsobacter ponti]MCP8937868.1 dienelactone hydrolase family protein [Alsobacter ponti]